MRRKEIAVCTNELHCFRLTGSRSFSLLPIRLLALATLLLGSGLFGCSGKEKGLISTPEENAVEQSAAVVTTDAHGFPLFPTAKNLASWNIDESLLQDDQIAEGDEYVLISGSDQNGLGDIETEHPNYVLIPGEDELGSDFEWAMYGYKGHLLSRPTQLLPSLEVAGEGEPLAFIGLANYTTGRWEFRQLNSNLDLEDPLKGILNEKGTEGVHERYVSATGHFYFVLIVDQLTDAEKEADPEAPARAGVRVNSSSISTMNVTDPDFGANKPHIPNGITVTSGVEGYTGNPPLSPQVGIDLPDMTQWPHIWWQQVDGEDNELFNQRAQSYYVFRRQVRDEGGAPLEPERLVSASLLFGQEQWVDCAQLRRSANPPLVAPEEGDIFEYWLVAANNGSNETGNDRTGKSVRVIHEVADPILHTVQGRVLSGADPVPDITIQARLRNSGQTIKQALTDDEGRFSLDLPGGAVTDAFIGYELFALNGQWTFDYPSSTADISEPVDVYQSDIDFDALPDNRGPILLKTFSISGNLTWVDGTPPNHGAAGYVVSTANADGGPYSGTSIGQDGFYNISKVPAGTYTILPDLPPGFSFEPAEGYTETIAGSVAARHFVISAPPLVTLSSDPSPASGTLTRSVLFTADGLDPDMGGGVSYEWDLDYDGIPENFNVDVDTNLVPNHTENFNIQTPIDTLVAVRVTDDEGVTAIAAVTADINGFIHSWGTTDEESFLDTVVDSLTGEIYCVGCKADVAGTAGKALITKLNADGTVQWIRQWVSSTGASYDFACARGAVLATNGDLYVVGSLGADSRDSDLRNSIKLFMLRIHPDGTLERAATWYGTASDANSADGICEDENGLLWVGGYMDKDAGGDPGFRANGTVLVTNLDLNVGDSDVEAAAYILETDEGFHEYVNDLAWDEVSNRCVAVGSCTGTNFDADALVLSMSYSAGLITRNDVARLGVQATGNQESFFEVVCMNGRAYAVGGENHYLLSGSSQLLHCFDPATLQGLRSAQWGLGDSETATGIVASPDENIVFVSGSSFSAGNFSATLLGFDCSDISQPFPFLFEPRLYSDTNGTFNDDKIYPSSIGIQPDGKLVFAGSTEFAFKGGSPIGSLSGVAGLRGETTLDQDDGEPSLFDNSWNGNLETDAGVLEIITAEWTEIAHGSSNEAMLLQMDPGRIP